MLESPLNQMEIDVAKNVKKRVRREYTAADVKLLKAHSKARTPVAKLTKLMKRSEGSLRQKALALELVSAISDRAQSNPLHETAWSTVGCGPFSLRDQESQSVISLVHIPDMEQRFPSESYTKSLHTFRRAESRSTISEQD